MTFIVRVEFDRAGLRENRLRRHFKRFFLPGALFVERAVRANVIHFANLTRAKVRNESSVDIWLVKPSCFLRHNGVSRIHRVRRICFFANDDTLTLTANLYLKVAKTLKAGVVSLRWLAKLTFDEEERYGPREVMEIAKAMAKVTGVQCAWLHPPVHSRCGLKYFRRIYVHVRSNTPLQFQHDATLLPGRGARQKLLLAHRGLHQLGLAQQRVSGLGHPLCERGIQQGPGGFCWRTGVQVGTKLAF